MTATFDSLIQDHNLQMLKEMVPFIPLSKQRTMAFFIKFLELQKTMSLFDQEEAPLQACALTENEEPAGYHLLSVIRKYCTPKDQEAIDTLLSYMMMFNGQS